MTAAEIAEHISKLPAGARVTVVYEVTEQASPRPTVPPAPPSSPTNPPPAGASASPSGVPPMKLREAKARYGIPMRELQSAVRKKFLPAGRKTDGKDAGAYLVTPEAVEEYQATRERVSRGLDPAPAQWPGPKPRS